MVGEGDTYEEALTDVKSAIKFHIETFGKDVFETDEIMETFIAEVAPHKLIFSWLFFWSLNTTFSSF